MTKKELFGKTLDLGKWLIILVVVVEVLAVVGGAGFLTHSFINSEPEVVTPVVTPPTEDGCVLIGYKEVCPR